METIEDKQAEILRTGQEAVQDLYRVEFALQSEEPGVLAAGKYLRSRMYRIDMEWELNNTLISLHQKLIENVRRRKFIKITGADLSEEIPADEIAPKLARNVIDSVRYPSSESTD